MTGVVPRRLIQHLFARAPMPVLAGVVAGIVAGIAAGASMGALERALAQPEHRMAAAPAFVGFAVLQLVAALASWRWIFGSVQRGLAAIRADVARHVAHAALDDVEQLGLGPIMATLTDDTNYVGEGAAAWIAMLRSAFAVVAVLALLLVRAPHIAVHTLATLVLTAGVVFAVHRIAERMLAKSREATDEVHAGMRALVQGAHELLLHAERRREFEADALQMPLRRAKRNSWPAWSFASLPGALASTLVLVEVGVVLFSRDPRMDIAQRLGVAALLVYLVVEMDGLAHNLPKVFAAELALARIQLLREKLPRVLPDDVLAPCAELTALAIAAGEVERAQPGDEPFRIGPLDLELRRPEVVFLTGANGAGKSTLVRALLGQMPLVAGTRVVDSRVIGAPDLERYRQFFSYVSSTPHVFAGLAGVDRDVLRGERASRWIARLELEALIDVHSASVVPEQTSSGEHKRIALLAAILEDRPVLVLDEWAAEQDPDWRRRFYRDLLPELRAEGKLVFAISHDDRYFDVADRVLKLADGRVTTLEVASRRTVAI